LPFSKKDVELAGKISYTPFTSYFYLPRQLSSVPHKYDFFFGPGFFGHAKDP